MCWIVVFCMFCICCSLLLMFSVFDFIFMLLGIESRFKTMYNPKFCLAITQNKHSQTHLSIPNKILIFRKDLIIPNKVFKSEKSLDIRKNLNSQRYLNKTPRHGCFLPHVRRHLDYREFLYECSAYTCVKQALLIPPLRIFFKLNVFSDQQF